MYNYSCTPTLTNCTISGNYYYGIYHYNSGLYIKNTILANNTGRDLYCNASTVTDNGYNIVEDCHGWAFTATGDIYGPQADLNLRSSLADNGTLNGTKTLALYYNESTASVAIDAGSDVANNGVAIPTTDQRGAERYDFTSEANVQSSTDIGAYEDWAGNDASLPVELSSFTAENRSGGVLLKWSTESEIENLGFILGRRNSKLETGNWEEIASYLTNSALEGHGSTTEAHEYQFTDSAVQPGVTYAYRLGDVDYNGKVTWHGKVEIKVEAEDAKIPAEFGLQKAYPNPFNPAVTLSYGLKEDGQATLQVFNLRGQLVETLVSAYQLAGAYDFTWQPENLGAGVYIIRFQSGNKTNLQKVVFVK